MVCIDLISSLQAWQRLQSGKIYLIIRWFRDGLGFGPKLGYSAPELKPGSISYI